jgi:hypothetical protein
LVDRVPGYDSFVEDTSAKANRRYFELLRQAGPAQRLAICASLTRATRELAMAGIRASYPEGTLSPRDLNQHLAERLYGAKVARRLFAARPE